MSQGSRGIGELLNQVVNTISNLSQPSDSKEEKGRRKLVDNPLKKSKLSFWRELSKLAVSFRIIEKIRSWILKCILGDDLYCFASMFTPDMKENKKK